nr:hypothetical protein [uncultured Carboxylicivirga sp.]
MKQLLLIIAFIPITLIGQQSQKWVSLLENHDSDRYALKTENSKERYLDYDFSDLITPKSEFLGFIGDDYKRIQMYYSDVEKGPDKDIYYIEGHSIVGSNKCDFLGTITIKQIREFKTLHLGVDAVYRDSALVAQGLLIAEYSFDEDPNQNYVGTFKGIMTLWWYIDRNGKLRIDNIENYSDSYKNNQYIGTWTGYGKSQGKICNWGEFRIPFSGDLDIGAGEFSVNPKYIDKGWNK